MNNGPSSNTKWLYDSPINSEVEAKLRRLLVELGNADKILGIQVCAYKDGKVIIDTAAGVMGKDDHRPVQPDTLFPVFSATKGVTAGMMHWLADKGKLKLDDNVANIWPEFGTNGKHQIKIHHVLNHTSGMHNALAKTEPGHEQFYHYLSYGWLCGGIIEHASGKKFQDILEEAFVRPLNVEGEFYIGIPLGVESRLASLTYDKTEYNMFAALYEDIEFRSEFAMPSSLSPDMLADFIPLSNTFNIRRAILPAINGHFSARALARYYAALVDGGAVPPRHSSTLPLLGSQPHHPTLPSKKTSDYQEDESTENHTKNPESDPYIKIQETSNTSDNIDTKIFSSAKSKIHDAFLGRGDYKDLIFPNGKLGLGFWKAKTTDGSLIGFGHAGVGGSTGYCDVNNRFSIALTLNKLSFGPLVPEIIQFVCSELDLPVPQDYSGSSKFIDKR
ncbi:unnamed protein product [Lactuca saligna]|uniref:Beta-lactamase-related domain-containing protein n=1 Tax=Lactuca saligna TaxID=75948 RepID=A0AA36E6C0_LACSI|nr:unnamed protein product [Lactuca saligna]